MSSLKDLASLIMVPSLYKDGELHTVKPLGNSILHPDATGNHDGTDGSTPAEGNFTFSRGSNLAATRVDVNGLIEKGRENVLLYSNDFTLGNWSNDAGTCTRTGGQAGYDGSNDAWLITQDTAGYDNIRSLSTGLTSGVSTMSVYAKAGTSSNMHIRIPSDASRVQFNLSTGVATNKGGAIHQGMDDVGGGWYRCYATFNSNVDLVQIYPEFGSSTPVSIYIQDAQLEAGLVATDYIETGASTAQAGILEDMPRLDYSGSCPALLLEPQRTNAWGRSEYINLNPILHTATSANINYNVAKSPEGYNNAAEFEAVGGISRIQTTYFSNNGDLVVTIFAKQNSNNEIRLNTYDGTSDRSATYNLSDGSVSGVATDVTASTEEMGDGWYRCIYHRTNLAGSTNVQVFNSGGTFYIYGLQVEKDVTYPTSYIPTYGSSVTRSVDEADCTDTGITSNVGTWYLEFGELNSGSYGSGSPSILINPTSGSAYISILSNQVANTLRVRVNDGTTSQYVGSSFSIEEINKYLIKWDGEFLKFFRNGSQYASVVFSTAAVFSIMNLPDPTRAGLYPTRQVLCFPTALTDSECIALTTL